MSKIWVGAFVAGFVTAFNAEAGDLNPRPAIGSTVQAIQTVGCAKYDDYMRLLELSDDKVAFVKFALRNCKIINAGVSAKVEDTAEVWSKSACIRPQGETDCLWVSWNDLIK